MDFSHHTGIQNHTVAAPLTQECEVKLVDLRIERNDIVDMHKWLLVVQRQLPGIHAPQHAFLPYHTALANSTGIRQGNVTLEVDE